MYQAGLSSDLSLHFGVYAHLGARDHVGGHDCGRVGFAQRERGRRMGGRVCCSRFRLEEDVAMGLNPRLSGYFHQCGRARLCDCCHEGGHCQGLWGSYNWAQGAAGRGQS